MSITRYKELLTELNLAARLSQKAKLMQELNDVKIAISTHCSKKFSNLPANLGIVKTGAFCRGAYLKFQKTPLGSGPGVGRFWSDKSLD